MRVGSVLESMAARHASGILQIDGNPSGAVYFDQGQITCARASWIPDIGARLLGALGPGAESPDLLAHADEPDRDIGTFLVQRNRLSVTELAAILRSVIVDTVMALTATDDDAAFISDIRFTSTGTHWAAAFSCQDVHSVLAEAGRRAERIARYGLARGTPVRLHELGHPSAVLTRAQWTLACAIDGTASPQDLAWRCGLALYQAIEDIGELIAAGLCLPVPAAPPAPPAGPLAEWFGSVPPSAGPVPPSAILPRRSRPAAVLAMPSVMAAQVSAADIGPFGIEMTPPAPDLLRRVLDGLKRV